MSRKIFAISILLLIVSSTIQAVDYSSKTHFYAVEFLKPIAGNDPSLINITVNRKLDAETAERILREEIQRAIDLFPPNRDITAYMWTQTNPSPGTEQMVKLPDGSYFLIYSLKTKLTQTEKEYDLFLQKPAQIGKELIVKFALRFEKNTDGRTRIIGTTNLPQGMVLMLDLSNPVEKYFAQNKIEVGKDGKIVTSWFSDRGKPLALGVYDVNVSSPLPTFQPEAVLAIIGDNGENLMGPIRTSGDYIMVKYKVTLNLR